MHKTKHFCHVRRNYPGQRLCSRPIHRVLGFGGREYALCEEHCTWFQRHAERARAGIDTGVLKPIEEVDHWAAVASMGSALEALMSAILGLTDECKFVVEAPSP